MSRYRVVLTRSAARDIRDAYEYLRERSPQAALQFESEVTTALDALRERAHEFGVWRDFLRRIPLRRFPHGFLYEMNEAEVIVVALAHPRREPTIWSRRRS